MGEGIKSPLDIAHLGPHSGSAGNRVTGAVDQEDSKRLMRLFEFTRSSRQRFQEPWERQFRLWATDAWSGISVPAWRSQPQVNLIKSTIETIVSTMTDQSPQIVATPRTDSKEDADVSEVLTKILSDQWEKAEGSVELEAAIRDTMIYGTGFMKILWDKSEDRIFLQAVPVDQIYWDPQARDEKSAFYCFHVYSESMNFIKANFPDKVGAVAEGSAGAMSSTKLGQFDRDVWGAKTEFNQARHGGTASITSSFGRTTEVDADSGEDFEIPLEDTVMIVEAWEKDPESGKIRMTIMANGVVLKQKKNPLGSKIREFPFIRFVDEPITGQFYGHGECQALEPIQLWVNKLYQMMIDNVRIFGAGRYIADKNSGIEEDVMTGAPGEFLIVNDVNSIKPLDPPPFPPGVFELAQSHQRLFEQISGIFDVVQGEAPSGIEAASAIAAIQEAAQIKIRKKTRRMESGLRRLGKIMLLLIQQNMAEERVINLVLDDGTLEIIKINAPEEIQNLAPEDQQVLGEMLDEAERQIESVRRAMDITRGDFDVLIHEGSTRPINRQAVVNEALLMYDRGIYGPPGSMEASQTVLEKRNDPQMQEIMQRRRNAELAAQQAAMAQQQALMQAQAGAVEGPVEGGNLGSPGAGGSAPGL